VPVFVWECVRGLTWANDAALEVAWKTLANKSMAPLPTRADELEKFRTELGNLTVNLTNTLIAAHKLPDKSLLVIQNMQWAWDKSVNIQAAWNLRDAFKANFRTLVMLTGMGATIPDGLRDALPLAEELPTLEALGAIVDEQFEAVGIPTDPKVRTAAIDAVCGLPGYRAEQSIAISFKKVNSKIVLDTETAWKRKCDDISQVRGLSVKRGGPNFDQVGGNAQIIKFYHDLFGGKNPPRVLVLLDEFEKMLAGVEGGGAEGSQTKSELIGALLTEMEERNYTGLIKFGVPGASKTHVTQCAASQFGVPLISLSIPDTMEKFVGSSNENFRSVMQMIYAVSQGRAFFIGTCNSMVSIGGPLRRRFCYGAWMFDLPTEEEKLLIWPIHLRGYGLDLKSKRPDDRNWTGAEIRNCCRTASEFSLSLVDAAQYISPVAETMSDEIDNMRQLATRNHFKNAARTGAYQWPQQDAPIPQTSKAKRAIRLD